MPPVPLGRNEYKRQAAGTPEIRLLNRFFEQNPANLIEQAALLARAGSSSLSQFEPGPIRGCYATPGLFSGDLFIASGDTLWRYATDGTATAIDGTIFGSGHPEVAWMKGEGYEYLFITDGLLLQYYNGGTFATGTLTLTPDSPPDISTQVIQIGGFYYSWDADVDNNAPDGSAAHPWLALIGATDADSLESLYDLINYAGIPGVNFSTALAGPNLDYRATALTATTLTITALSSFTDGTDIATGVDGDALAWGAATLTGGDTHALAQVLVPDGAAIKSLTALAGHVLASVGNSRKFFWILPGEVIIDPLNFAEKESNPDDIIAMLTLGDQVMICGGASTEAWYATGDLDAPFAPIKGAAYRRGVVEGTAVVLKNPSGDDVVILVGEDNVVYEVGPGVKPISNNAVSERIRAQLRREAGLP